MDVKKKGAQYCKRDLGLFEEERTLRFSTLPDTNASLDVIAFTVITLGLVFLGSCNEEIARAIRFSLKNRSESELGEPLARLLPLGLGLLYLGKQDRVNETAKTINLAVICTPVDYNTRPLDTIYSNFIDALPVVKYCSENGK
nr:26S proteasome non-ATPase regulatory subunit 2 homolog A-like [Ipomoea trifida]